MSGDRPFARLMGERLPSSCVMYLSLLRRTLETVLPGRKRLCAQSCVDASNSPSFNAKDCCFIVSKIVHKAVAH